MEKVKKSKLLPSLAWPTWIIVSFIIGQFLLWLFFQLFPIRLAQTPTNILTLNAITYVVIFLVVVSGPKLLKIKIKRPDFATNRLMTWRDIGWAIIGFLGYLAMTVVVSYSLKKLFPSIDLEQTQDLGFTTVYGLERLLAFIMLVLVAPIVEELIFRGLLQTKLKKSKMPVWLVVLVVSFVFALAHGQLNVAIDVFVLGIMLSVLREKTESIWSSVLVHIMKNFLAFYVLFVL